MKKTFFVLIVITLVVFNLPAQQTESDLPILTVLDFTTESVSQNEMKTIISLLSSSLFQMEKFTVIDVSQRENILSEIEFSSSGCTDESCMLEIGRLLAAEMIVVGSLSKIGSRYVLSSKLLETQTGKTLGTADGIYTDLDAMLDDLGGFSAKLVGSVAPGGKPTVVEEPTPAEEPVEPEPEIVEAPKPAPERGPVNWKKIGGIGLTAAGVIAAGAGGYFAYSAYAQVKEAWLAYDTSTEDQLVLDIFYNTYLSVYDEKQPVYLAGMIGAIGGVLAAGAGVLLLVLPEREAPVDVAAVMVPGPRSLGLVVSLTY